MTNHTFNFLMIGGDSKSRVFFSPLPYPRICRSAHTHTHMHVFFQYVHITHKQNKWDSVKPSGGWIWIITMIFQCQHYPPNKNSSFFCFFGVLHTLFTIFQLVIIQEVLRKWSRFFFFFFFSFFHLAWIHVKNMIMNESYIYYVEGQVSL